MLTLNCIDFKATIIFQMNIHINYFTLPDDIDPDNFGTVDALLVLKEKIEVAYLQKCVFVYLYLFKINFSTIYL